MDADNGMVSFELAAGAADLHVDELVGRVEARERRMHGYGARILDVALSALAMAMAMATSVALVWV